jgi:hypothetical protein
MECWAIVAFVALSWVFGLSLKVGSLSDELKFQKTTNDENYRLLSSHDRYIIDVESELLDAKDKISKYEEKLAIYQKAMESVLAQEVELTKGINQTNSVVMGHIAAGIPAATWWGLDLGEDPQKMREATCTAEEEEPKKSI